MIKKSAHAKSPLKDRKATSVSKNQKVKERPTQSVASPPVGVDTLSAEFEAFRTLAENAPDAIFRVDRNLRFVFVNQKISELTVIPKERFYGKTLLELGLSKFFSISLGKQVQKSFDNQTLNEFEFSFNGREGLRWFHVRIVPEFDIHGDVETVLGIAHDITDLKRAELAYKEERAFRDSIERSLRIGVAAVDLEGRQSYVNPSFCEMVGWSKGELLGASPPFVYWPPEEVKNITQVFQQVFSSENFKEGVELRFQRRNGERFDALVLFSPLKDEQGNVIGWIRSVGDITEHKKKDEEIQKLNFELEQRVLERTAELKNANEQLKREITERKRAEEASRKSEAKLRAVFQSLAEDVVFLNTQGDVEEANDAIQRMHGHTLQELTDPKLDLRWQIIRPDGTLFAVHEQPAMVALRKGEVVRDVEMGVLTSDGGLRWRLVNAQPVYDDDDNLLGAVASFFDITERKRAEEEIKALNRDLKRRAAELEMANKELEAFSYSVSHDLKAPLIVASGFCRRLSEHYGEKLDARSKHYLQRIQEAYQRMNLLIEELLKLSQVTIGRMKVKSVDLSDLARSIATQLEETQPKRKVSFLVEEGVTGKGDSGLLRIALQNLLGNAWKFTSKSKRAKIEFGLMKTIGDEPAYFVRDNGCGFDMSMADKLFTPFQRLHEDEEFSGTGVGLASVHRIITRHGGRIWAESAIGKGATFFFTLPSQ